MVPLWTTKNNSKVQSLQFLVLSGVIQKGTHTKCWSPERWIKGLKCICPFTVLYNPFNLFLCTWSSTSTQLYKSNVKHWVHEHQYWRSEIKEGLWGKVMSNWVPACLPQGSGPLLWLPSNLVNPFSSAKTFIVPWLSMEQIWEDHGDHRVLVSLLGKGITPY